MLTIYEIRIKDVTNPVESADSPFEAIVRCAELRFAGFEATAYEVVIDVEALTCERNILY